MTEIGMALDLNCTICTVPNEVQTVLNEVQTRSNVVCAFRILFRTVRIDLAEMSVKFRKVARYFIPFEVFFCGTGYL